MKFKAKRKAYTLLELLISISIMAILVIISIASFSTYDRRNSLILTADSLKSFILNAKADAQSRDSDLWGEGASGTSTVILTIQGGHTINEYRSLDGKEYPNELEPKVFRSYIIDKKYSNVVMPDIIIKSPTGRIESRTPLNIDLKLGGDTARLNITNDNITITRSF